MERGRQNHYAVAVIDLQWISVNGGKRVKRFVGELCQVTDAQGIRTERPNKKAPQGAFSRRLLVGSRKRIQA